jgi:hypothetical protein
MQWFVDNHGVAGFANTKEKRDLCNAKFRFIGEEIFLVATKDIKAGEEVFAFYSRSSEIAAQKQRQLEALERLAAKKGLPLQRKLDALIRRATRAGLSLRTQQKLIASAKLAVRQPRSG